MKSVEKFLKNLKDKNYNAAREALTKTLTDKVNSRINTILASKD